jgi:hypothetical protein
MLKIFAYSLNAKNGWECYCNFRPKEIMPFPSFIKEFQNFWIYGYDEDEQVAEDIFVEMCTKWKKRLLTCRAGNCMGQEVFQFELHCRNFQSLKKRVANPELWAEFFSKSEFLFHISSTCLLKGRREGCCRFLLEPPKLLVFGGNKVVVSCFDGLSYVCETTTLSNN